MQISDLKQYLLEDQERIIKVLEFYGFHSFSTRSSEIRCAPPNGENRTSVVVKLSDNLFSTLYSDTEPIRGDLIELCIKISNSSFKDVVMNIHALLGLSYTNMKPRKRSSNPALELTKYIRNKQQKKEERNKLYDASVLSRFTKHTHAELFQEAILPKVAEQFRVGFDLKKNRITFPHFDWIEHDKVVGVQGRIVGLSSDQANLLGIPKYWNYIKGYKKSLNLYGWNFSEKKLEKSKRLILFEAEKSVLKQFSYENGEGYSVALGGHEISEQQVRFILKNTSADCEIIIAFDKDIMKNEKYLIDCCKRFSMYRKTSYIYDRFDNGKILKEKDSPVDNGYKIYKFLFSESERRTVD